jgi:hypothetical protein
MNIKSPVGDIVGNCLVVAGMLGPECTDESPVKETYGDKQQDSSAEIPPEYYDASRQGTCDARAQAAQPFVSDRIGGGG